MVEPKPARSLLSRLSPWIRVGVTAGILGFLAGKVNCPNWENAFFPPSPAGFLAPWA